MLKMNMLQPAGRDRWSKSEQKLAMAFWGSYLIVLCFLKKSESLWAC